MFEANGNNEFPGQCGEPLWTRDELEEAFKVLPRLKAYGFDEGRTIVDKRINVEGYPMIASLIYRSPEYVFGAHTINPIQFEQVVEIGYPNIKIPRVVPLTFHFLPDEDQCRESLASQVLCRVNFGNGRSVTGYTVFEENGDIQSSGWMVRGRRHKGDVVLPSSPSLLVPTTVVGRLMGR